ncbi:MAG TPA: hypothetical protein VGI97_00600 [Gemmatimonadaceae bacterium]|jgi:hypothetical protein
MATIQPIFDQPPETERLPTPYRDVPYSPLGFGAATAGGVQELAQVALHEHQQHRAAQVMQQVGQFGEQADVLLHDPKAGALNLEGEKALGAYDGTVKALRDLQTKAAQGIADPGQRAAFMEHSEGVLRTAVRQLEVHTSTQGEQLKTTGLLSTQKSMFNSSVKAIDQTSADSYMATAADATRAYWTDHANAQIAEEKVQEYVATANAGRLDRLLANPNTQGDAIRFFQSRHDALPADKLDTYEAKVAAVGVATTAQPLALGIVRNSMGKDGRVDPRGAQGLVDALQVPEPVREKVQQLVDHHTTTYNRAWTEERDAIAGKVLNQITDSVTGETDWSKVNAADDAALELKDPIRHAAMKKGAAIATSKAHYAMAYDYFFGSPAARERTAGMSPDEFRTDPMLLQLQYKHKTPIVQMYDAMQKNINKQAPKEALVLEYARPKLGLGDTKIGQLSASKQEKLTDLMLAVQADMQDFVKHHDGQTPDSTKQREIIEYQTAVTASHWFTADELRFQAGAAERRNRRAKSTAVPPPATAPVVPAAPTALPATAMPKGGAPPGFAGWRTSASAKMRYPADAKGNILGPGEPIQ